jgi:hypothetical protein
MAFEGFQLRADDYDDMRSRCRCAHRESHSLRPPRYDRGMHPGRPWIGHARRGNEIVATHEVALAEAGRAAAEKAGFVAMTIAAAFSTASAINVTVFATGPGSASKPPAKQLCRAGSRTNGEGVHGPAS